MNTIKFVAVDHDGVANAIDIISNRGVNNGI